MAKKPKKKKSEEATVRARVEEVLRIRLDGAQAHDVLQYASEKKWDLTERQVRTYMRRADNLLVERQERNRRRIIAQHMARRESLYARAVNAADYRTSLAVLSDLAKLQSLYASDRDLKDLAKLAIVQGQQIRELENRLATCPAIAPSEPRPSSGPDAGDSPDAP